MRQKSKSLGGFCSNQSRSCSGVSCRKSGVSSRTSSSSSSSAAGADGGALSFSCPSASSSSVAENSRVGWWASGSPCGGVALSSSGSAYGRSCVRRRLGERRARRHRPAARRRTRAARRRRPPPARRDPPARGLRTNRARPAPRPRSAPHPPRRDGRGRARRPPPWRSRRVGAPTALEIEVLPDGVIQQAHGRLSVTSAGAGWRGTRRAPVRPGQPALIVRFLPARLAW